MKLITKFSIPLALLVLVGVGCGRPATQPGVAPAEERRAGPERGTVITITNCQANPAILQASNGTEVTFVNTDSQAHTLLIDNQEVALALSGSTKFMVGRPANLPPFDYTTNFLCDGEVSGAIFIPAP